MQLHSVVSFPSERNFVLKLHRDVAAGKLFGRLENLISGHGFDSRSAEEMLAFVSAELIVEPPEQARSPGAAVRNSC